LEKKWFTLIEALDDTIDTWSYGRSMYDFPVHNSYVPVRHTIMPKPLLTDDDDIGFRYEQTGDKLGINPVAQKNPLKNFRMTGGVGPIKEPKVLPGPKWASYRRLSHIKRNFSTRIVPSSVSDVDSVYRYFANNNRV